MKLIVKGKPIAKARPRFFAKQTKSGRIIQGTYSPQRTEESLFLFEITQQLFHHRLIEGPVILHCEFFMPIPKSTSKRNRALMENGFIRHTKKPDIDNLIKFVKDCLNGIVWKDDSQVVGLRADKRYGEVPRTEISIIV